MQFAQRRPESTPWATVPAVKRSKPSPIVRWIHKLDLPPADARALLVALGAGIFAGIAWALLTPQAVGIEQPEYYYALGDAEAVGRQDGVFMLITGVVGALHGAWLVNAISARPVTRVLMAAVAGIMGAATTWLVGMGVAAAIPLYGDAAELVTDDRIVKIPLTIHAFGVMVVWPMVAMFTASAWLFVRGLFAMRRRSHRR